MADSQKKPKMKLYYFPSYRSVKAIWLIREMGIADDFEFVRVDSTVRDSKEVIELIKNVHPHGTIPALEIEGESTVLESGAICLYLADLYGKLAPDLKRRKDYYDWSLYANITMDGILNTLDEQWMVHMNKPDDDLVKRMIAKFNICLDCLERTLKDREFICGNSFTAADCALGYMLYWAAAMKDGILLKKHPKVLEYYDRLQRRPAFQDAVNMK